MKGLIFIPDISGFTNFVNNIDIEVGVAITKDLLNVIIDNNPLNLKISEIEGDAVLFYKIGKPIPLQKIFSAFLRMHKAFDIKYQHWKRLYNIESTLSLKLILHYGDIKTYDVKGFKKLYGEAIIEAHQLLKSGNSISKYILVTKDYAKSLQRNIPDVLVSGFHYNLLTSQMYRGAHKTAYYFFSDIKKVFRKSTVFTNERSIFSKDTSRWIPGTMNQPPNMAVPVNSKSGAKYYSTGVYNRNNKRSGELLGKF